MQPSAHRRSGEQSGRLRHCSGLEDLDSKNGSALTAAVHDVGRTEITLDVIEATAPQSAARRLGREDTVNLGDGMDRDELRAVGHDG